MTRYALVADLNRCVGCQTCTAACKHANATSPGVQWRRVLDFEAGEFPDVRRAFVPVGCMHCADPPCMDVCPSTATRQRPDGLVTIDYDICIGCSYCTLACPYQARTKVDRPSYAYGARRMAHEAEREDPERFGVAQKCSFCIDRIDSGLAKGLTPGAAPEATPACVVSCIAGALHFGDVDDPASNVSRLIAENEHFRMHEELGTKPGIYYLWQRKAAGGETPAAGGDVPVLSADEPAGVAPRLQSSWDWRAAANFMAGGSGAGLLLASTLAALAGAPLLPMALLAMALVGAGLLCVWLEIGRPWRFLNVFRHSGTSWMSREAMAAVLLFGTGLPAVAIDAPQGHLPLAVAAASLALVFLYSQARIMQAAKGIPAWREPAIVPLVVVTGLAEGAGLFLAATLYGPLSPFGRFAAIALVALLALRFLAWRSYRRALGARGAPTRTLAVLDRLRPVFVVGGHVAPLVLLGSGLAVESAAGHAFALAGLTAFAGGWVLKHTLVTRAAFNQGFALQRMPARGAGTSAAGIKPGWRIEGSDRAEERAPVPQPTRGDGMALQTVVPKAESSLYYFEPQAETMPRRELAQLQLERLRRTLAHAYERVPHYRRRFDELGVRQEHLRDLADLRSFPLTVKSDLRDAYPFGLFALPRSELRRLHASSGTTGKPTVVGYSAADLACWSDLMARSMACAGARPGDIVHNAYGYGLFTGGLGAHYGAERLGCVVVPLSGGGTERQVMLLKDFAADMLCATPSYALNIAEVAEAQGIDIRKLPVRRGLFGAEPWSNQMRAELESRLGIKAIDIYGLSEIMGPGVACECDVAQSGLHGWEDHFLFEIVDPETLAPKRMGEAGELVITTLTKEALPMIRYRTRDITRLTDEPCGCGRTHLRILRITGRDDDMMIIRGVNVFPSQIEAVLVGLPKLAPQYQISLTREGSLDKMTVEVELAPDAPADPTSLAAAGAEAEHHIKSLIGVTCEVIARAPGELPRSQGKAVRVRDQRKG